MTVTVDQTVSQPANGQPPAEVEAIIADTMARRNGRASTLFKVAGYLQTHPRRRITPDEVAQATGIAAHRASEVLQQFVKERTDVERVVRGQYMYYPGRGSGIKREPPQSPKPPARPPAAAYRAIPGARTRDGHQVVQRDDGQIFALVEI